MLSLSKKQLISYCVAFFIFIISCFFFINSLYIVPSLIFLFFNIVSVLYIIFYTYNNKEVLLFSPMLEVIYCSIFYYTFMGLYCYSKFCYLPTLSLPTTGENEYFYINTTFLIFFVPLFLVLIPTILAKIFNKNVMLNFSFMKRNYNLKKTCKYLYFSFGIVILFYLLTCFTAGYTPISAILNPGEFRAATTRGFANYFFTIYQAVFVFNFCLTIQLSVLYNLKNKCFKYYSYIFYLYCLFWGFFSGGRMWFVLYTVYFFVIYSFKKKIQINFTNILKSAIVIILLAIFIGAYGAYRVYRSDIANGNNIVRGNYSTTEKILIRLDTFSTAMYFFQNIYLKNNQDYFSYNDYELKNVLKTQIFQFIPRQFMSDKMESTHGEITKNIAPNYYYTGTHLVFGGISAFFFEGGIYWLWFNFFILGLIVFLLESNIKVLIRYDVFIPFYLMLFIDGSILVYNLGLLNNPQSLKIVVKLLYILVVTRFISYNPRKICIKKGN